MFCIIVYNKRIYNLFLYISFYENVIVKYNVSLITTMIKKFNEQQTQ